MTQWAERITQWLREEPKVTAKRIRRLLLPLTGGPVPRARCGATSRSGGRSCRRRFGESWVDIAGVPCKVKYLVATLPFSNAYFAKAYTVERLESLLDGIESALLYFGGLVDRVVFDNTSLAVKAVLAGRDRVETEAFEAFVFRPRLAVESWAALNAAIIAELETDLPTRHLDDGGSARPLRRGPRRRAGLRPARQGRGRPAMRVSAWPDHARGTSAPHSGEEAPPGGSGMGHGQ